MGWGWSVGVRACGFGVGGCFEPFLQGGRSVLGDDGLRSAMVVALGCAVRCGVAGSVLVVGCV